MPARVTAYQVLIELTEGLEEERRAIAETVHAFNEQQAIPRDVLFLPLSWDSSVLPRQKLLGEELRRVDYLLLVLSDRWPPGAEREFERALAYLRDARRPMTRIVAFFKQVPERQRGDPGELLREVLDFREHLAAEGEVRAESYASIPDLEDRLRRHLTHWLIEHERRQGGPAERPAAAPREERSTPGPLRAGEPRPEDPVEEAAVDEGEDRLPVDLDTTGEDAVARQWQSHPLEDNAEALNEYGLFLQREGYAGEAESMHRQALELANETGPPEAVAVAQGNLGVIHLRRHELESAEQMFLAALETSRRLDRPRGVAAAYTGLGLVYRGRDELDRAEEMVRSALRVEKELGRPEGMVAAYGHLGLIFDFRGQPDRAEEMRRLARAISEEPEYPRGDLYPGRI